MSLTRNLRLGSAGEDVWRVKLLLMELGCYAPHVTQLKTHVFGRDTRRAVLEFQRKKGLAVDGVVGRETYRALLTARETALAEPPTLVVPNGEGTSPAILDATCSQLPQHLVKAAAMAIGAGLDKAGEVRREMARDALQFAYDPATGGQYPLSFYIRGGNLYNSDLLPNVMTKAKLTAYFNRTGYAQYYDGGRKEMMQAAAEAAGYTITGADCSGGVVGLLRHAGVVNKGFDLSANGFYNNTARYRRIPWEDLRPGDLTHKMGHIGLYVGGGYVVEWIGGAYGCQLTKLKDRRAHNFVTRKNCRLGAWTGFLSPTYY